MTLEYYSSEDLVSRYNRLTARARELFEHDERHGGGGVSVAADSAQRYQGMADNIWVILDERGVYVD